jgi:adenylate cyclase
MSTTMEPREVVGVLNHFFDLLCPILKDEQADIDKFIGDCIMALFEDLPDWDPAPVRAARAALRMQEAVENASASFPKPLQVRIGINTGSLVRGDLGSRFVRRDYTVIGDVVNRAQRLEANAPRGGVLISDTTYAAIKDHAVAEPLVITMKGVAAPVTAYVLQELRS